MIYSPRLQSAIRFSVKVHEIDQKQKRKNKDVAYITHPLTVGLILAKAGADEDVIIAGILHDTIEDSVPDKKITREAIANAFGERVADLVGSVTEISGASWEERKKDALARIGSYSHDSLLIKSADLISNGSELIDDFHELGESIFDNFERSGKIRNAHYLAMVEAVLGAWPESPLFEDLQRVQEETRRLFKV